MAPFLSAGYLQDNIVGVQYCECRGEACDGVQSMLPSQRAPAAFHSTPAMLLTHARSPCPLADEGEVNNNEMVELVREPHNPYDNWAIQVDNVRAVPTCCSSGALRM